MFVYVRVYMGEVNMGTLHGASHVLGGDENGLKVTIKYNVVRALINFMSAHCWRRGAALKNTFVNHPLTMRDHFNNELNLC